MDPEENPAPRKLRFAPKRQNRRNTKSTAIPKVEDVDDDDVDKEAQEQLLKRFNESRRRQRPKVENKSSVPATFIHQAKQSTTTRASDRIEDGGLKQSYELDLMHSDDNVRLPNTSSSSAAGPSVINKASTHDLGCKKEYKEPWDYDTDYPTTLPWRRPYSGNPDILDEAEFGEAERKVEYDETKINPASELGFLNPDETNDKVRLLLFKLPDSLPAVKRTATAKGKEVEGNFRRSYQRDPMAMAAEGSFAGTGSLWRSCTLEELSAGQMGKLLVYKTGAVKLKLGETLYDASPGSDCTFAQEVTAVNTKQKEFCEIRALDKRVIITPDVEYLLNSVNDIGLGGKGSFNSCK